MIFHTCFLKTLKRSLTLHENRNGLFVIDMSELCQDQPSSEAAFTASSSNAPVPPGLETCDNSHHADTSSSARCHEEPCPGSAGSPPTPVCHLVQHDSGNQSRGDGVRGGDDADQPTGDRSPSSEEQDPRTQRIDSTAIPATSSCSRSQSREPKPLRWWPKVRRMGTSGNGSGSRGSQPNCTGPKYFHHDFNNECNKDDSQEDTNVQSRSTSSNASSSGCRVKWTPVAFPALQCITRSQPGRLDPDSSDHMGTQIDHLGKEEQRKDLRDHVRNRSFVQQVDSGKDAKPLRRSDGLCQLRGHPSALGERGNATPDSVRSEWEAVPNQTCFMAKSRKTGTINDNDEANWLKEVMKIVSSGRNACKQIDLLEVYAYPNSQLTQIAQQSGLRAERFGSEDGNLSTFEGQCKLLTIIILKRPKHIWLSPDCLPWCAWSRFNALHSWSGHQRIHEQRELSKIHLKLCNFICKLQINENRHVHFEHPWTSEAWKQSELQEFLQQSLSAKLDFCMFDLRHPETEEPMQKHTRIQTTSRSMFLDLDHRVCNREHTHAQIAGTCRFKDQTIKTSKFASFYTRQFAKKAIRNLLLNPDEPMTQALHHVEDTIEEPAPKRSKTEHKSEDVEKQNSPWNPLFWKLQKELPKSGVKERQDPLHPIVQQVRQMLPDRPIGVVKAGKGLDRYIAGDPGWQSQFPLRHTIAMKRFTHEIEDLGCEDWSNLSKLQQRRKAISSHIMVCVFMETDLMPFPEPMADEDQIEASSSHRPAIEQSIAQQPMHVDVPTWTPLSATVAGPKFQELSKEDQSTIVKLHRNLGHPTSERLSKHLSETNARRELVLGA